MAKYLVHLENTNDREDILSFCWLLLDYMERRPVSLYSRTQRGGRMLEYAMEDEFEKIKNCRKFLIYVWNVTKIPDMDMLSFVSKITSIRGSFYHTRPGDEDENFDSSVIGKIEDEGYNDRTKSDPETDMLAISITQTEMDYMITCLKTRALTEGRSEGLDELLKSILSSERDNLIFGSSI